ncbi:MAG: sporulation protein YqfD [Oscillospiraceae bacterium]|nr:sporulation protein YqfD [Oscillospiraceae bacterium]
MRSAYWITEGAEVRLTGEAVPELLNDLALGDVPFSRVRAEGGARFRLFVRGDRLAELTELAEKRRVETEVLTRRGLGHFLRRFRGHIGLLLAPALLLAGLLRLSDTIWEIDVVGNRTLSRTEILAALEELNVGVGHNSMHIDNELVRSRMQEKLGRLSYLTVRVSGSKATVIVRERREPPEMVEEDLPADVVAGRTGLVERMSVLEGKAEVKPGDAVLAGETLITGGLTDLQNSPREVHAMGDVWARTWYQAEAILPLEHWEKAETGRSKVRWALKICNFRLNLYFHGGISYEAYDKIQSETRLALLGSYLPVSLVRAEYREYTPLRRSLDQELGEAILRERLLRWLREESGCPEPETCSFSAEVGDGFLRISMAAECLQQIGLTQSREG